MWSLISTISTHDFDHCAMLLTYVDFLEHESKLTLVIYLFEYGMDRGTWCAPLPWSTARWARSKKKREQWEGGSLDSNCQAVIRKWWTGVQSWPAWCQREDGRLKTNYKAKMWEEESARGITVEEISELDALRYQPPLKLPFFHIWGFNVFK